MGNSATVKKEPVNGSQVYHTPNKYQYQYVWPKIPDGVTSFKFKVRGSDDAHVALSRTNGDVASMYEIVLGGWGNTKSAIRLKKQGPNKAHPVTQGLLSKTDYRQFRVEFADDLIKVSRVGESPFMSFQNTTSFDVKFIGIASGWGCAADWQFCGFDKPRPVTKTKHAKAPAKVEKKDARNHDSQSTKLGMEDGRIHDKQITASSTWTDGKVDHGIKNARLNRPGAWPAGKYVGSWCAQTNDRNQWIQVSFGEAHLISGVITQGRSAKSGDPCNQYVTKYKVQYSEDAEQWHYVTAKSSNEDMEFNGNSDRDTPVKNLFDSPIRCRYIRIRPTAWVGHVSMRFELLGCKGSKEYHTPNQYQYQYLWPRIPQGVTGFRFRVRGSNDRANDAHIALSRSNGDEASMYEIVLGGWGNTKSAIRLTKQGPNKAHPVTKGLLSKTDYREFDVEFADDLIKVSRVGESPFMSFQNTTSFDVKFIGIASGWGCAADWQFCGFDKSRTYTHTKLGMEDGRIQDKQITASSTWGDARVDHGTKNARLNRPGAWPAGTYVGSWCAQTNDTNQWIQVVFREAPLISGVITQGRSSASGDPCIQYVTKYKVQYSEDGKTWYFVKDIEFNQDMEFNGNSDRDTLVRNLFDSPVRCRYIRIKPTAWVGHVSLRFELLGCKESGQTSSSEAKQNKAASPKPNDNNSTSSGGKAKSSPAPNMPQTSTSKRTGTSTNTKLGMEDGRIHDSQITASSTWPSKTCDCSSRNARLNRAGGWPEYTGSWCAQTNDINQWVQVAFRDAQLISGVITQGRSSANGDPYNQYVTKYKVYYSEDGECWDYVKDKFNQDMEFNGNSDREIAVRNLFDSPVRCKYIRIRPTAWMHHISMRFELLGCQDAECATLGLEDGRVRDSQITASSSWPSQVSHAPSNARLNRENNRPKYVGSWKAATNDANQWIQVSLEASTPISGVITQGRSTSSGEPHDEYVTEYKVEYSNDEISWSYVTESNNQKIKLFVGNRDRETPVTNRFDTPIHARFIRIRPMKWNKGISLRFELLQGEERGQTSSSVAKQNNAASPKQKDNDSTDHIMISYQWDSQERMKKLRDELKKDGHKVWMDIDNMEGNLDDAMADAVDNASMLLCCFSKKYQESKSCKKEAQYASYMEKHIIPLNFDGNKPTGWLGLLLGNLLYYNVRDDASMMSSLPEIKEAIQKKLQEL